MSNNRPVDTIRDGALKLSIWENQSERGPYLSATIAKTYKDERDGLLKDTQSLSAADLLKVSELARQGYARANEIRRENHRSTDDRNQQRDRQRDQSRSR